MERLRPILRVAVPATLLAALVTWLLATPPRAAHRSAPTGFRGDGAARYGPPDSSFDGAGAAASAVPADGELRQVLEKAVNGQIAVLKKRDYKAALRFATANFRQSYTPARFGEMVKRDFPDLATSRSATFGGARRLTPEMAEMEVAITGKNGKTTNYLYTLVREGGGWHVMSVVLPARIPGGLPAQGGVGAPRRT